MIEIVAFKPEHLTRLKLQATQATAAHLMTLEHGEQIAACPGLAKTAMLDGEPIVCAGMIEMWSGRAYAWAYIAEGARASFKQIHRAALSILGGVRWRRVEMAVDIRDPGAKRWASHLGFDFEGVARKWTIDGRDVEIWARVN